MAVATRSGLAPIVKLASRILAHHLGINVALVPGLSDARTESANNNRRLLTRLDFWTAMATDGAATLLLRNRRYPRFQHQVQQGRRPHTAALFTVGHTLRQPVPIWDRIDMALECTQWRTFTLAITSLMRTMRSG